MLSVLRCACIELGFTKIKKDRVKLCPILGYLLFRDSDRRSEAHKKFKAYVEISESPWNPLMHSTLAQQLHILASLLFKQRFYLVRCF